MSENTRVQLIPGDTCSRLSFFNAKANCLDSTILNEVSRLVSTVESPILLIESEGEGAFCAGASFSQLGEAESEEETTRLFSDIADTLSAIIQSPALVICRVHGATVGGGLGLVCAADYSFGTSEARFKLSELDVGLAPSLIFPLLRLKMGVAASGAMTLDRLWRGADWAFTNGLLDQVGTDNQLEKLLSSFDSLEPRALEAGLRLTRSERSKLIDEVKSGALVSGQIFFRKKKLK